MWPRSFQYGIATANKTQIVTKVIITANLKISGPLIRAFWNTNTADVPPAA